MELVKRYTYAVTQKLPESQRADIEKELKSLIEDMLEERVGDGEAAQKDVEAVLLELGDPQLLADKYRGYKRYLIGPEIFPTYLSILKIVFMAIGIAMLVVFAIQTILTPQQVLDHFGHALMNLTMGGFQAFAWVTIVFAVMEYTGVKKGKIKGESAHEWRPSDLSPLPDDESKINRADPIGGIIFTVLFVVLVTFSINQFGIWIFKDGGFTTVIPFFDEQVFRGFLPFIWAVSAVSILANVIQLITRKWSLALVLFDGVVHTLNFVLAMFMFSNQAIWNPGYLQQMAQSGLTPASGEGFRIVTTIWRWSTEGLVYLIGVIFAIQIIVTIIKILRMKSSAWKKIASLASID